ncbi:HAMP domain-containing sensor histidine kinase [Thalassotalea sp. SU-HH00458]|uniref:sensor histidine kinase n=1 Tax=Thalassotalea sp. SU-HH00458 TaxID=3127657 RepID=UPI003105A7BF
MLKINSLEKFLSIKLLILASPSLILLALYQWQAGIHWQWIIVSLFALSLFIFWSIAVIKFRVMRTFTRAELHIDAIKQEDYNQFAKPSFSQGKVKAFHQQLNQLSDHLLKNKLNYDQQVLRVYQLINQLDVPILLFNQMQKLSFANDACTSLFEKPWHSYLHASAEQLGLSFDGTNWHYRLGIHRWQIKHSQIQEQGQVHQLLLFLDNTTPQREGQLIAWQKIIPVLSQEIKNSLSPISSMSETLADQSLLNSDRQMLQTITERCQHLHNFIDRYSLLNKDIEINRQNISVAELADSLKNTFHALSLTFDIAVKTIWVDLALFEQVFIDLLENAQEAEAKNVQIIMSNHEQHLLIEVIDDGHGFDHLDNLFIPYYSTKFDGQGIGLNFCKNVIEHHQGVIELHNNEVKGVTIMIIIPLTSADN